MPQRAIPTITSSKQLNDYLKNYQQALTQALKSVPTPVAPFNFKATSQRGGILLTWSPLVYSQSQSAAPNLPNTRLSTADGYELQRSSTGNFAPGAYVTIALRDATQSSHFDSVGGVSQTFYYRLRATNGSTNNPYTTNGLFTMVLKATSIDSSDVATQPVTTRDTFTNSTTNTRAGHWPNGVNSPFTG